MHHLGIDIGSKTIKLVLLDEAGALVHSDYFLHRSRVQRSLIDAVHHCAWLHGDDEVDITVTGSAGLRVAELFNIPFVQEVVALKRAVGAMLPGTDVVLEMGGEDTKLVYLSGTCEQRMNTACAGGTGGFIDMMAGLMGVRTERLQGLAMGHSTVYPIASRCAVFAKSDVRPLLNAGARKEDVAASVLEAVCTQAVAGLSAGRPIAGKVALLGGPFQHVPYLRQAFCKVTGIPPADAVIPANAHLYVAWGAALAPQASASMSLSAFERMLRSVEFCDDEGMKRLPALFQDAGAYERFQERHAACKMPRASIQESAESFFIGIDAGSTTMKVALINEDGALCAYRYGWNEGDVTDSLPRMLKEVCGELSYTYMEKKVVRRSCIVGYGEAFCRAAYKVDAGEVETVAHLRAAKELEPDLDFLMDIGGQDIKCLYVRDGVIEDMVLNEACSSGCGSLFDAVARSMGYSKEGFAALALSSAAPVDLGTRCSTFMDSRVKHAQKEGVDACDIAAGVCYSTARNALHRVVKHPDFRSVGKRVVVQGGAFANDALLRAFELETGVEVSRPDLSQLMGAWGAALLARDEWLALREADPAAADRVRSGILDASGLDALRISKRFEQCGLCSNRCKLALTSFSDERGVDAERVFLTGNRCERPAAAFEGGRAHAAPPNMLKAIHALISSCDKAANGHVRRDLPRIGIPRALACYMSYPFWRTFFSALGFEVVPAGQSGEELFRKGMSIIPAEGACYPSKLVYGHCADLVSRGAELLFVPNMTQAFAREGLLGLAFDETLHECPLIERMGDMVRDNAPGTVLEPARLLVPELVFCLDAGEGIAVVGESLAFCGLEFAPDELASALAAAQEAYRAFFSKLAAANGKVLAAIDAGEYPGALIAGHPYHADPGINHGIDELAGELGYAVLAVVDHDLSGRERFGGAWFSERELACAVEASEGHQGLQLIIPRSFGCGVDAMRADAVHERIRTGRYPGSAGCGGSQRIYAEFKIDQIVDLAAARIRLRSLAYAAQERSPSAACNASSLDWQLMDDDEYERLDADRRRRAARIERDRARQKGR